MYNAKAYSAASATSPLATATIPRRDPTEHDVQIEILFCGICHSDLHQVRNEWKAAMPTVYPIVPGHEIVGRVTKVGSAVTKFKPGDLAASAAWSTRIGTCPDCRAGLEQFCPNVTLTYNSPGQAPRRRHLRRLLRQHRRRRTLRPARPRQSRSRRSRAAALRRDHDLLADAPLGRHQGQESRRGRSRRTGPHGREVCARVRRPRRRLHHVARQEGRRAPPRRRRGRRLPQRRRDAEARRQLRLHPRHRLRRPRHQRLPQPARAATATSRSSARPRSRWPSRRSA